MLNVLLKIKKKSLQISYNLNSSNILFPNVTLYCIVFTSLTCVLRYYPGTTMANELKTFLIL